MAFHHGNRPRGNTKSVQTEIVYDQQVSFATNLNEPRGPTIPGTVDDTCLGILFEYTSIPSGGVSVPSGWTLFYSLGTGGGSDAILTVCYKILSTADRGTSPGATIPTAFQLQRDQLLIFKNNLGPIRSVTRGNSTTSAGSGSLSVTAPKILRTESAIVTHHFYNTDTNNPTVSMSPSGTLIRNTSSGFAGSQYEIYTSRAVPQDTTSSSTLTGVIRQGLGWLIIG